MSKFTFDQKNRARFLSRTISCVIFLSCTNREIVFEIEFFRDFEPWFKMYGVSCTTSYGLFLSHGA